jgi:two-component system, NarL family, nitrate/nitrite response regulator NarL
MQDTFNNQRRHLTLVHAEDGVLASGAASLISSAGNFDVVVEPELSNLIPRAESMAPELILLALSPAMTLRFLSLLRQAAAHARIVLWDHGFSEELVEQARELGGFWFLERGDSAEEFLNNISGIARGDQPLPRKPAEGSTTIGLTQREAQLITLLVQGLRNKEIGACLGITEGTVRIYLTKLFIKVGARDRFELAVFGLKNLNCGHAFWDGHNAFVTDVDEDRARPALRSLVLVEPKRRRGYHRLAKAAGE